MIRFIDLRGQILDAEDYPVHFAFYDTVSDEFIKLGPDYDWNSRAEFLCSYREEYPRASPASRPLDRFLSLMPEWVK